MRYANNLIINLPALLMICLCASPALAQDQRQTGNAGRTQTPQSVFREAYPLTTAARTIEDFDRLIEMCEGGLSNENEADKEYGQTLTAWLYNKRGELFAEQTDDPESAAAALADFDKAVTYAPDNWRYVHNRGVSLAATGRFDEAIIDVEKVIELQPQFAKGYFNRAELHFAAGEMEQAVQQYSRAIDLGRNDAEAYANRGDAYAALGLSQQALRDYQRAISLETNMARAYQAAAWILATSGEAELRNPNEALRLATQAAQLQPDSYQAYDVLALCQAGVRDYSRAAANQQTAIDLAQAADASEDILAEYRARLQEYETRISAAQQTGGSGR